LTVNTQYTAYIVVVEAGGSVSAVLTIANVNPVQPDTAPPVLSGFAESETTTANGTTVRITFTASEAATYHYFTREASQPAPALSEVQAAMQTGPALAGNANTFILTGLTTNIDNILYIAAVDLRGNWSTLYTFTVHPVKVYAPSPWTELNLTTLVANLGGTADMIYANGKYVVVGSTTGYAGIIAYSSTGTGGWQAASIPANNPTLSVVAYGGPSGSQKFVAAGDNTILTSADGITWNSVSGIPTGLNDTQFTGILWTGSQFFAYTEMDLLTSPDGLSWTANTSFTANYYFKGVAL
jgi:hypothetical protein